MHKLDRLSVEAPNCLQNYNAPLQSWSDFGRDGAECKQLLRARLVAMQGNPNITNEDGSEYRARCAYCEGLMHVRGHIEHFRRKNSAHFPELTFEWNNLFLSCQSNNHCGHYKDRKDADPYNPDDLIKPDAQDPDAYLYFHSKGTVRVRQGIAEDNAIKAAETIRVFGLNNGTLPKKRTRALESYKRKILDDLNEALSWEPELRDEYIEEEIERTQWEEYSTTIKHFLSSS